MYGAGPLPNASNMDRDQLNDEHLRPPNNMRGQSPTAQQRRGWALGYQQNQRAGGQSWFQHEGQQSSQDFSQDDKTRQDRGGLYYNQKPSREEKKQPAGTAEQAPAIASFWPSQKPRNPSRDESASPERSPARLAKEYNLPASFF